MVTARAAEAAAGEQQPRVREILQDLWDQFDLPDKPKLEEQMAPGGLRARTFDTMSEISAWAETITPWMDARVQVDVRSPCFDDQGRRVS
ncbi:hypothetical protein BJF80_00765 [Serinicoccus sp. CUA-874]|nr:hypothetical protein BJF80_00765 [Serinicoccus sp. CUA-874]